MKPEYEPYAKALEESLTRAKMTGLQIQAVVARFLTEAARTNPARALVLAIEGFANEDGYLVLQSLASKSKVEEALEKISTEHPYTLLTPRQRIQRDIEKIKQKRNALECEIVLDESDLAMMAPHQVEAFKKAEIARKKELHVEIPTCFAATATYKDKPVKLELEVRK